MKKNTFLFIIAVVLCNIQSSFAQGIINHYSFYSNSIGGNMHYNVYLPPSYEENPSSLYPVLYLFHGLGGRYYDWANNAHAADTLNKEIANGAKEMLVIMPDGLDSWYIDNGKQWESYMYNELIPTVQDSFRVGNNNQSRAVAGLSMGGWGTTYYWIKYGADMYSSAYCMSGALGVREGIDLEAMINDLTTEEKQALPPYTMEIGTEDHLYNVNVDWHDFLSTNEIEHTYIERPGVHDWLFWTECLPKTIRFASDNFGEVFVSTQQLNTYEQSVSVFPNPANDYVTFDLLNAEGYSVQYNIYSVTGQLIKSGTVSAGTMHKLDISEFESGLYVVNINNDNRQSNFKLMVN
ncbi:MAG: T9SS type A sorting domain-containing protein [Bacteroidales bacterium]|nr:T9SS type A sorting domain-containing protein [Bacteroidales bacterium]